MNTQKQTVGNNLKAPETLVSVKKSNNCSLTVKSQPIWLAVFILLSFIFTSTLQAQNVGINSTGAAPDASVALDISATGLGLLIPRMTLAQRPAIPVTSLIIYQTDNTPGFYYYDGTSWIMLSASGGDGWTDGGTYVYLTTTSDKVSIGGASPAATLDIQGEANRPGFLYKTTDLGNIALGYSPSFKIVGTDLGGVSSTLFGIEHTNNTSTDANTHIIASITNNNGTGATDHILLLHHDDPDTEQSTGNYLTCENASGSNDFVITMAGGVVVGSPTGGDKGAGTINAIAVYDDNVLLTDYVFDKYFDGKIRKEDKLLHADYKMMSLNEMIEYMKKEKHLPTISGRKEWKKNGKFSTGQLITQLWETVETQALYIKELKEMIDQYEIRLKAIENQLEEQ